MYPHTHTIQIIHFTTPYLIWPITDFCDIFNGNVLQQQLWSMTKDMTITDGSNERNMERTLS
jgi:hypothetical protein